ncbi:hypothetical protein Trydic_g14213 [Trypoxylus dichotomus]
MLSECTTVKIEKLDGLPMYVCRTCMEKLCSAWDFKLMAVASDIKLRVREGYNSSSWWDKVENIENETSVEALGIKDEITVKCEEIEPPISRIHLSTSDKAEEDIQEIDIEPEESNNRGSENPKNFVNKNCAADLMKCCPQSASDSTDCTRGNIDGSVECSVVDARPKLDDDDLNNDIAVATQIDNKQIAKTIPKKTIDIQNSLSNDECVFDENGLPITKGGRKLTRKEKEKMTVFCKHCNCSFGWKYYKWVHLKHHTGDRPHKCDVCDKAFVLPFQLKIHQKLHANEVGFSCEICGKHFKHATAVYSHKFVHTDERPHKCGICGKGFKNPYGLTTHLRTHSKERLYMCEVCGKAFRDHGSLTTHKVRHVNTGKTFLCTICGKNFASIIRMRDHAKKAHTDKKPHVCSYCGKSFKEAQTLKVHALVHTGEKPHSCHICGKQFRQLACISRHMRIHTGETPYPCELCSAKFKYSHHLKNHMKIHSG